MSGNVQTVDEQIMYMVGMGFEIEDCQAAVEHGILSVEEAVEWILGGKPGASSTAPTLKLNAQQNDSAMDIIDPPLPASGSLSNEAATSSDPLPVEIQSTNRPASDVVGNEVSSRLNMSEEQRLIKKRFEEKQREEARRLAQAEKQAKKKAHAEALQRIQEDREKQRERVGGVASVSGGVPAGNDDSAVNGGGNTAAASGITQQASNLATSLLQIRLPDGRCLRQSYSSDSALTVVQQYVVQQIGRSSQEFCLIQPFPHIQFDDRHMEMSLRDLGFVPNGSLVVKISADVVVSAEQDEDILVNDSKPASTSELPAPLPFPQQESGEEQGMMSDDDAEMDIPQDEDDEADDDDDDNVGQPMQPPLPPFMGAGVGLPGFGGVHQGGGLPGLGRGGHAGAMGGIGRGQPGGIGGVPFWGPAGHGQHVWGDGQRLAGEVLENVALPHHRRNPTELAVEAAQRRHASLPPAAADITVPTLPSVDIPMLRDLVIKYVGGHICTTRNPITGLQGLPAALANRLLDHLVKEGLLRPKTLQPFISCHLQDVVLDCYSYCTNELLAALRHHIYLKNVSLHSCPLITHQGLQHLTALKLLKQLNIGSCRQVNDNCIPVLIGLRTLVTLVLEDTGVTDGGIIQYASSSPPSLQNLDLNRTHVTQGILSALQAIPNLTKLNLEQTKVTGLAGIEGLSVLKVLNLANTAIVTDSLLCIQRHPSLAAVNIANTVNVNGDIALQYLSGLQLTHLQLPNRITTTDRGIQFLAKMPLTTLDLTNFVYITDASLQFIGQITTMRKLRLSNTRITDAGMPFIEGLKNLEELHLDRTLITDTGARIVEAFGHLQELNLSNTGITNTFLTSGALDKCRELSKLNLSRTSISDKGTSRLRLPLLTMLNIDDTFVRPDAAHQLPFCPLVESIVYRTLRIPPTNEDL